MVFGIGSGTGDEKSGAASAKPGGRLAQASGLGSGFLDAKAPNIDQPESKNEKTKLVNRAGESKSPYVRGHMNNPVAWQLWGDEAIELAKKENRLLFVSIGYSACHWCHVMERESFENDEVAAILNSDFIPIKIDREERPDIDRIYMNFVQATTGSGGWPLNVFITPTLEPVFGGTYWPGPHSSTPQFPLEDQLDFLGILKKLSSVWKDQEDRCREDSAQILERLKEFAAEGTFGGRLGEEGDGLDLEILEEAYQHFASTFDRTHSGFGSAPKFPTPTKLSFLLRLSHYAQAVIDIVGADECIHARQMAISTLKTMARGGIHDHIGHGFARYSVTADWSLPHFEKMLYDNAQLLHVYLDAFLSSSDPELLGVVYDVAEYLTTDALAAKDGGFYSSEDADSFYRKGDAEKREGAFYVWTSREVDTILGSHAAEICSAFWGISSHGNVSPENDVHDEFINQNVLSIASSPKNLAAQFGMSVEEIVKTIKESRNKLRAHRDSERVRPALDDKIIVGWNGIAIGALARASSVISVFDLEHGARYLASAKKAAEFIKKSMYNPKEMMLKRVWRDGFAGETGAFADDYAFLIEGLIDLYESTFEEEWLRWANDLQKTQLSLFYDTGTENDDSGGGFFATPHGASHTILRLKDGMDTSEPSTNGTSACNLFRLSSYLADDIRDDDPNAKGAKRYVEQAKETIAAFEAEILQYPWGFGSFMPAIVASRLGIRGTIVLEGDSSKEPEAHPASTYKEAASSRGGLNTTIKISPNSGSWLRDRNRLLKDITFPRAGASPKVLICENGVCREEGTGSKEEPIERPQERTTPAPAEASEEKSEGAAVEPKEQPVTEPSIASATEEQARVSVIADAMAHKAADGESNQGIKAKVPEEASVSQLREAIGTVTGELEKKVEEATGHAAPLSSIGKGSLS